jgi:type I restriction enzyme R subunit
VLEGKAMIVGMSREICARLYTAIVQLRPAWHDADIEKGAIKVVMTGSAADPESLRPHFTIKREKKRLEKRFKNPDDPLRLVIVRDMWLTGFDVPCCHTMYVDKPMHGHSTVRLTLRMKLLWRGNVSLIVSGKVGALCIVF